jgi:hypothetical protein
VILAKYFVLAKGTKPLPRTNDFPWPYEVAVCFETVPRPIGFSEGVGHGQAGGIFSAQDALGPTWKEHFSNAGGDWLLPFVRELAEGRSVSSAAVIKKYQELHGVEPQTYECNFS